MHIFGRPIGIATHSTTDHAAPTEVKEPSTHVHETALGQDRSSIPNVDSPPLTSSLHSRNSASSAQESAYLRRASLLRWIRLSLALLVAAAGATVLGCAAHVFREYDQSVMGGEWFLPLWPVDIDVRPGLAEVVAGVIVMMGAVVYIGVGVVPSPRSRFSAQNLIFAFTSIMGLAVSMFAVVYGHVVTFTVDAGTRDTLMTFTCRLYDNARTFASSGKEVDLSVSISAILPQGFGRLCVENQVARWMMVALFVIESLCLVVAAMGIVEDARIARVRKLRYAGFQDEKSSFA